MEMSFAYVMIFTGEMGVGRSDIYKLKSMGERIPPCGTPVLNWWMSDLVLLKVV